MERKIFRKLVRKCLDLLSDTLWVVRILFWVLMLLLLLLLWKRTERAYCCIRRGSSEDKDCAAVLHEILKKEKKKTKKKKSFMKFDHKSFPFGFIEERYNSEICSSLLPQYKNSHTIPQLFSFNFHKPKFSSSFLIFVYFFLVSRSKAGIAFSWKFNCPKLCFLMSRKIIFGRCAWRWVGIRNVQTSQK